MVVGVFSMLVPGFWAICFSDRIRHFVGIDKKSVCAGSVGDSPMVLARQADQKHYQKSRANFIITKNVVWICKRKISNRNGILERYFGEVSEEVFSSKLPSQATASISKLYQITLIFVKD